MFSLSIWSLENMVRLFEPFVVTSMGGERLCNVARELILK